MISYKEFIEQEQAFNCIKSQFDEHAIRVAKRIAWGADLYNLSYNLSASYSDESVIITNEDGDELCFPPYLLSSTDDEIDKFIVELKEKMVKENLERAEYYKKQLLAEKEAQFERLKKELGK